MYKSYLMNKICFIPKKKKDHNCIKFTNNISRCKKYFKLIY